MESITLIAKYVSLKFVDQFLKEEGYGRIKKFLFPKSKYSIHLKNVILETVKTFETKYSNSTKKHSNIAFYQSKLLFDLLNKHILFETEYSHEELVQMFSENPKIKTPTLDEISNFYHIFIDNINKNKTLKKLFINENYKNKIIQTYGLIEDIKYSLSLLIFNPTNNWFENQCRDSIQDLGKRYTPKLNVKLSTSDIFEGLARTEIFEKKVKEVVNQFLIKGKEIITEKSELKDIFQRLENNFNDLYSIIQNFDFKGKTLLPTSKIEQVLTKTEKIAKELYDHYRLEIEEKEKNSNKNPRRYSYALQNIREFETEHSKLTDFIHSTIYRLANNPFLLLHGEAGIGKSHIIGDIVSRRTDNAYNSILLLGQHFVTEEDPWTQIFKILKINLKTEDFLKKINKNAEAKRKRVIIFIDAVNEGKGILFWNNSISSFIDNLRKYEWLGLVLTVRTSYKDLIFPRNKIESLNVIEYHHYGFNMVEYEASRQFFNEYGIALPSVPFLHPEFQNPLFLKLFCEGINKAGLSRIPEGLQGLTSIIDFFLKSVNNILSNPRRAGYSHSLNLVQKSIQSLIKYKVNNQLRYVPYEMALQTIDQTVSIFLNKKGFIDELIAEGVLSKNLFWKENNTYEEGVYLAYERLEDHLTAKYIIDQFPEIDKELKKGGKLYNYVKDEQSVNTNKGLIEALSIQVPETKGKDFFSFIPTIQDKYPIIESFVKSLLWRKVETIDKYSLEYVNRYVLSCAETEDIFWETVIAVTSLPNHFFNANLLHRHLIEQSLAERDANWTTILKYKYIDESSVKRLIDWAWSDTDKSHISDESIKLSSIALGWFLTSTNRELRDCSTKALICLLQDRLHILKELLILFDGVNDPYIYERLFAIAYGCSVRTEKKTELYELSMYIYETIFNNKDEIYPHILLRDYARGVIEFTHYSDIVLPIDPNKIRPPYRSSFPKSIMTIDEIDKIYKFHYDSKDFKDFYWAQNTIIESMATEYGRGTNGYGDFGRYTFESALCYWDVDTNELSNLALEWIFEKYGYDVHKHGEYDQNLNLYGRSASTIERIGKKYQWIAFYEILARVSDNFIKYDEWSFKKKKESPYQGTWNPYVRDIDPTILISKTGNSNNGLSQPFWWTSKKTFDWNCSNDSWIRDHDLPNVEELIQVKDDKGEEWLVLEGYPSWSENRKLGVKSWNQARKQVWYHIRSYLVKDYEFSYFKDWAIKQDFMGRWMPESGDRYEMFSREYYWSPAQDHFKTQFYGGQEWAVVYDKITREYVSHVNVTAKGFLWEEEFDKSKQETISFLKPSNTIYEGMNLKYSRKEGEYLDEFNEVQCFATNIYHNSKSYLLIRKIPFKSFLRANNLRIVWTVLGEKQITGGRPHGTSYPGRLEISGAYYFKSEELVGNLQLKTS